MRIPYRKVSTVLLDFVYGEPLARSEMAGDSPSNAWQKWLDAVARQESLPEFEPTRPMVQH